MASVSPGSFCVLLLACWVMLCGWCRAAGAQEQGGDLRPFVLPWDDATPGVTNLSDWNHKPAGKFGPVRVGADGHLYVGDERIRFFGVDLTFGATTVTSIYKDRWQIELFFKALKQNLKIKTFVGTSPNALKTQIWTALIAMLLLKYLQLRSRLSWALSNLVALLRWNLFTYRDLWLWIDKPFETPPLIPVPMQLPLRF